MIGLHPLETEFQMRHRSVVIALRGLGGKEHLFAAILQHQAHMLLAHAAAVGVAGVEIIHAQINRAVHDVHGQLLVALDLDGRLATKTEDAHAIAGPAEIPHRHGGGGARVEGQGRQLAGRGGSGAGNRFGVGGHSACRGHRRGGGQGGARNSRRLHFFEVSVRLFFMVHSCGFCCSRR